MAISSTMRTLGWQAADFSLRAANPSVDLDGQSTRSLAEYADRAVVVVVFTCNHCPYAIHVEPELVSIARDYAHSGVQLLAICSNDASRYPADSFEAMVRRAEERDLPFPYLQDPTQVVAKAYDAACTPDTFVFDGERKLVYRGRIDETRPGGPDAHGRDLRDALDAILSGETPAEHQHASIGCGIKWLPDSREHRG